MAGKILFIGNLFFERFFPFLRQRRLSSLLLATWGDDGAAISDEVVWARPDVGAEQVIELALERGVTGVIAKVLASHEYTALRDAIVKERLEREHGIPVFAQSVRGAVLTGDKGYMRHLLAAHGILLPSGFTVGSRNELAAAAALRFPVVVKAPGSSFSRAVLLAGAMAEVYEAYDRLGGGRMVVEEFIDGQEIGVEALIWDGHIVVMPAVYLGPTASALSPHNRVRICPYFSPTVQQQIREVMTRLACLTKAQGILQADLVYDGRQLFVLELNGRFGGVSDLSSLATGRSLFEQAIEMVTGHWRPGPETANSICLEMPVHIDRIPSSLITNPQLPLQFIRRVQGEYCMLTCASSSASELLSYMANSLHLTDPSMLEKVASLLHEAQTQVTAQRRGG